MGLDFSYLLYFKREHLWDALEGVVAIAETHDSPIIIQFPDRELSIPIDSWTLKDKQVHHDDPDFGFDTVLRFEVDDEIEDYLGDRDYDSDGRSPPEPDADNKVSIGYIYLGINNDLSLEYPDNDVENLVLFDFGTTGTRMSMLFNYSTSIRNTFIRLLERYQGVCGVFNRESDGGELFWLNGQNLSLWFDDPYVTPEEIEAILRNGR